MSWISFAVLTFCQAVGWLLDMVAVLFVVRVLCCRLSYPILVELNDAGRPLVDRALDRVSRIWQRVVPGRPLSPVRLLLVAWLVIFAFRWCVAIATLAVNYQTSVLPSCRTHRIDPPG